jgi:outer membrane lipoprotein-sorting protein
MMGDSWMGSHFTNDDLVKDSRMADDYTYSVTFRGDRDGESVTELTCVPRSDAAVVWGKVVLTVRDRDTMPLRIAYFDEDLKPARLMTFSDFRLFGSRLLPARCRIVPADKPREATEIEYEAMEFDPALPAGLFILRSLEK